MAIKNENVLTEEFLYELFNGCFQYEYICTCVCKHMLPEYLPSREHQAILSAIKSYYKDHKTAPTFNIVFQMVASSRSVTELMSEIRDCAEGAEPDVIVAQFEEYITQVRFQQTVKEITELYNDNKKKQAISKLQKFAEWQNSFQIGHEQFVDIGQVFETRFYRNRDKHNEETRTKPIVKFYIEELDKMNNGRNLRGQLSCFMASTGVGKSHAARWIGKCAAQQDNFDVLHIQLEGSEDEVVDAYSASLVSCSTFRYENGSLRDADFEKYAEVVKQMSGSIKVRAFSKFANKVSTVDVREAIMDYQKMYGKLPDILIIDSMDLLEDANSKNGNYRKDGERLKRIQVAQDLKDLAGELNIWIVVTYQATIEDRDKLNDESFVLTEYNASECKGLSRPLTHLITLNQSTREYKEEYLRLFVAKSRFFKKSEPFKIATDYEHELFFDAVRTMKIKK